MCSSFPPGFPEQFSGCVDAKLDPPLPPIPRGFRNPVCLPPIHLPASCSPHFFTVFLKLCSVSLETSTSGRLSSGYTRELTKWKQIKLPSHSWESRKPAANNQGCRGGKYLLLGPTAQEGSGAHFCFGTSVAGGDLDPRVPR